MSASMSGTQRSTTRPSSRMNSLGDGVITCSGWVLKKRRKKMQGFARRYFALYQSGLLSYSFEPGQPPRDQLQITQAAISTSPGRKDITLDSPHVTFHIKCLSEADYNMWMTAFRKFSRDARDPSTMGRRSSLQRLQRTERFSSRTEVLIEEMGNTIGELQSAFAAWSEEQEHGRRASSARSRGEKDRKENGQGHSVLGIFKKHNHEHNASTDSRTSGHDSTYQRIHAALEALKYQHSALLKTMPSPMEASIIHGGSLSTTHEEEPEGGTQTPTSGHHGKRVSGVSSQSDGDGGSNVWYDAPEPDGAEEYVFDASPGEERESGFAELDHRSQNTSQAETESANNDTDAESIFDEAQEGEDSATTPPSLDEEQEQPKPIQRRVQLPSPPVGDEGSLFTVLKKNVGKDLSQVALPVSFNEPLTLLQKLAEEIEYYDLLSQAAKAQDSTERMCYVAAYAVSTYANTKFRTGRKGFNPMLAETFEDPRMNFISEKVCHNPVILAYHAEGEGWELYATSGGKTKFWGKSLEIIPQGTTHLKIGQDHYQWKRPSSFMRNVMMGTKYLEHVGQLTIESVSDGSKCTLDFKEGGYWGPSNVVTGVIQNPSGKTEATLEGKWDEQMAQKLDSNHLRVLWKMHSFPRNAQEYYGFTAFGITLNEITPDLEARLPPTDSRLRSDVRALEEGDIDRAEEEKKRIEEAQRERRKRGQDAKPRWFKQQGDEWVYTGGYWEQRQQGWKDSIGTLW